MPLRKSRYSGESFNTEDKRGRVGRLAADRMLVLKRKRKAEERGEIDTLADHQVDRLDRAIKKISRGKER